MCTEENDELARLRSILDGCDDAAIERVALVLFARSFIPMHTVDQVRAMWEDAPDSTLEATRLAALELIRAAGESRAATDEEQA